MPTIYVNNDTSEVDLFVLYTNDSCLLYEHTMLNLLITSYPQTESEVEEKTTEQA